MRLTPSADVKKQLRVSAGDSRGSQLSVDPRNRPALLLVAYALSYEGRWSELWEVEASFNRRYGRNSLISFRLLSQSRIVGSVLGEGFRNKVYFRISRRSTIPS